MKRPLLSKTVLILAFLAPSLAAPGLRAAPFVRGDVTADGNLDITDAINTLGFLFLGGPFIECLDAADADDSGLVDISDAIYSLGYQFLGGTALPAPFPGPGLDVTADLLTCPPEAPAELPSITITSPRNLLVVGIPRLQVRGVAESPNGPLAELVVKVNGETAAVDAETGAYSVEIPLREGWNEVTAVAQDGLGYAGSASVSVMLDTMPPTLVVEYPPLDPAKPPGGNDFVTDSSRITLTGLLNDIGSAQVGGAVGSVFIRSVDGAGAVVVDTLPADLQGKAFVHLDFPLRPGVNVIQFTARDGAGNDAAPVTRQVTFQDIAGQRINRIAGDGQAGVILTTLLDPLVVSLTDRDGRLVASRTVKFEVVRNSGFLSESLGAGNRVRELFVPTDASGRAAAFLTLGDRVGAGYNRVKATAAGFQGEILFCASALPRPPARILATGGTNQMASPGQALPEPLVAMAVDDEGNPIAGLPMTFEVLEGGGTITEGGTSGGGQLASLVVETNSEGLAAAVFHLGETEGINAHLARARFAGLEGPVAVFQASAKMPRAASLTAVVGLVLDNSDRPLEGVTALLLDTGGLSALSDAEGRFRIEGAPVGAVRLRIDGATTTRPGSWPALEFRLTTISGQDNDTGAPIRLPEVDSDHSFLVGGEETVVVTMEGVPGMTLTVFPGSVTMPNGDLTGRISLSQVKLDKIPMPPPNGSIFMPPAWTIQPPGVFFDPPARISIPNDGFPPGRIIDIFQFDHDLEFFTNVGTGTVSTDATVIISDPGFGVTKSGWGGCGQPPPPTSCFTDCNDNNPCTDDSCENGSCVNKPRDGGACDAGMCGECKNGVCNPTAADGTPCDDKDRCTEDDECKGGQCKGNPNPSETIDQVNYVIDLGGEPVEKILLILRKLKVVEDVSAKVNIGCKMEFECCSDESMPPRALNKSCTISVAIRLAGAKVKIPIPAIPGLFIVGSVGVDAGADASVKKNECTKCNGQPGGWEGGGGGSLGINASLGAQAGPDVLNFTVSVNSGVTGSLTIKGTCEGIELCAGIQFNGVSVSVTATLISFEVKFFEGYIVDPIPIGQVCTKIPVQ